MKKIFKSDFKSQSAVKFFQKRNNKMAVDFKTIKIPMPQKIQEAIEKTIKKIRNKSHIGKLK